MLWVRLVLVAAGHANGVLIEQQLALAGLAVGACTPPVGNCLNVCAVVSGMRIGTIFKGALPFLAANVLTLVLIVLVPALVLWLPSMMMD